MRKLTRHCLSHFFAQTCVLIVVRTVLVNLNIMKLISVLLVLTQLLEHYKFNGHLRNVSLVFRHHQLDFRITCHLLLMHNILNVAFTPKINAEIS